MDLDPYAANAAAFDSALTRSGILYPADVERDLLNNLVGQLMASTDPARFADMLALASDHAGLSR